MPRRIAIGAMRAFRALIVLATCGGILAACGDTGSAGKNDAVAVLLIQLIADPERYDGDRIIAIGFLHLEWEGSAVYLHETDFRVGIPQNAVRLQLDVEALPPRQRLTDGYVLVEGVYSADRGPMDIYIGRIGNVGRLERWQPPRGPTAPNR